MGVGVMLCVQLGFFLPDSGGKRRKEAKAICAQAAIMF
jgi:hypothetical protein